MTKFIGIEYGRGCLKDAIDGGCALAPRAVAAMFPDADWTFVAAAPFDREECARDRFGENFKIQRAVYDATDRLYKSDPEKARGHIMIGGDHSVNFGHFAAAADNAGGDLCLVYIDAHMDIHTPETGRAPASGAPHVTNVRALLGQGDERWMTLPGRRPSLRPDNLFYLGARSYEPAEQEFASKNNIYVRAPAELKTPADWARAVREIRERIGGREFVVSFDFDSLDPGVFKDVLVPAGFGLPLAAAKFILHEFRDAAAFEFVEYAPSGCAESARIVSELLEIGI
jgi:arginase family enzyme